MKPKANQRTGTDTVDGQGTETVIKAVRVEPTGERLLFLQTRKPGIASITDRRRSPASKKKARRNNKTTKGISFLSKKP